MSRTRVLVVEDKINMLKLCREILSAAFEVETAVNGQIALEWLNAAPFDVVLTDIRMPLLDGRQLLDVIRGRNFDVTVVLMTAYGTIEGAVDAMRASAFDYVTKPFVPNGLIETVRAAAEHRLARRQAKKICADVDARFGMDAVGGGSAAMVSVFAEILASQDWRDNMSGLESAIERALVNCRGEPIDRSDIASEVSSPPAGTQRPPDPMSLSYREALALARERTSQQYIAALLRICDGNVTRAADLAELERESLHRLMRRYGIRSDDFKSPLGRGGRDDEGEGRR